MDQAVGLRKKGNSEVKVDSAFSTVMSSLQKPVRVMAVGSGKGGVGKSNVVINLAVALDRMGVRTLIMDADLGLANIDVLLGLTPMYNLSHVLNGQKRLDEVLVDGPGNIKIMPASSGVQELTRLTADQKLQFLELLDGLETDIDVLLIDTGAGISDAVLYFNLAAHERIVVVTPEPTSLTDAYALIKVLYSRHGERHFRILVNMAANQAMGKSIFAKLSKVADHFLDGLSLDYLGTIPLDTCVTKSVLKQKPVMQVFPEAPASKAFMQIAETICRTRPNVNQGTIQFFWKRLLNV
ncbi:Cobyrinic acid a,c-diamide synthase [Syntrophobacter sp. SbD1]|nr:Cobyrinic acid a,c-diamide synthase [Syntrophobacter sp. SbD1]